MGQHGSKQHAPLTLGYLDRTTTAITNPHPVEQPTPDFVLDNPHLYKLELTCCCDSAEREKITNGSQAGLADVASQECTLCHKNKRLSLVRKDLAKDLEYIDETYYPPEERSSTPDPIKLDTEDHQDNDADPLDSAGSEGLTKLTIGEATPDNKTALSKPSLSVDLSGRALVRLSPTVGYLQNLTKLNISHNRITSLPRTIGHLKNLRTLNASHNLLECLPDTIAFVAMLKAINISSNKITSLPSSLGSLQKLVIIVANDNRLTTLPQELVRLRKLLSLNVSNNPITAIPAEISTLKSLRKLVADGCEFEQEFATNLLHDPPSLFEYCARSIVRQELRIPSQVPDHIKEYLTTANECSFCKGPYFKSFVTRKRLIERQDQKFITLEHRLCAAHWSTEDDRLMALFSEQPQTSIVSTEGHETPNDINPKSSHRSPERSSTYRKHGTGSSSNLFNRSMSSMSHPFSRKNSASSDSLSIPSAGSDSPIPPFTATMHGVRAQPSLPALPTTRQHHEPSESPSQNRITRTTSSISLARRFAAMISSPPLPQSPDTFPEPFTIEQSQSQSQSQASHTDNSDQFDPSSCGLETSRITNDPTTILNRNSYGSVTRARMSGVRPVPTTLPVEDTPSDTPLPDQDALYSPKSPAQRALISGLPHIGTHIRNRSDTL
ncbi:hypothetical protein CLU79DRAFT_726845 [Phycomyces nitens]|nr:hypothetical protein CLU79DRAFT_726845 [Phycomyces nitens]